MIQEEAKKFLYDVRTESKDFVSEYSPQRGVRVEEKVKMEVLQLDTSKKRTLTFEEGAYFDLIGEIKSPISFEENGEKKTLSEGYFFHARIERGVFFGFFTLGKDFFNSLIDKKKFIIGDHIFYPPLIGGLMSKKLRIEKGEIF